MPEQPKSPPHRGASQPSPPAKALEHTPEPKACKAPGDFSTRCPTCAVEMVPIHSHYQCTRCGYRDSCCF